jgi:PEGA domain
LPAEPPVTRDAPERFGSLSMRVQPGDAEIFIDGERWAAPSGQDRIAVQLSAGRHRVEVKKDGFTAYVEDVLIRSGNAFTLNVSLLRGQ